MPCPYFEPLHPAVDVHHVRARLPLLDEYDGLCRATPEAFPAPAENRFRCCNHGYSKGCCRFFPDHDERSSSRYDVVSRTAETIELLCMEEKDYAPVNWRTTRYSILSGRLEPEVEDSCMRSQILAFCRSYLTRFPR